MTSEPEPARSLPPGYFDAIYRASDDPWGFETRPYEAAKYRATLAALPRTTYRRGLEVGCSIGVLTKMLADRCDDLLAVDVSARALDRSRERCRDLPGVRFEVRQVPRVFPEGRFDLVMLSEVAYYWSPDDLERARAGLVARMEPGGHLLMVHWTPFVEDYPQTGDAVHQAFLDAAEGGKAGLRHLDGTHEESYRLDLFEAT